MNKRLHIIFIAGWYPSRIFLHNGDFIQRHAEAVALLHRVTVLHVVTDPELKQKRLITDEEINGVRTLIAYLQPSSWKYIRFFRAYIHLLKLAGTFDLIHVNKLFPAGLIALYQRLVYGKKYLITEHHTRYQLPRRLQIGKLEILLSSLISRYAEYVCPVSEDLGKAMRDTGLPGNYHPVPNVVFPSIFPPKKDIRQPVFTITHISTLSPVKNIEGILRVLGRLRRHIPEFHFNMIGGNAEVFREFIEENRIDTSGFNFLSHVPQTILSEYLRNTDVFILFSDMENLPCVILEAFSSGTAVVSSNVGGIKEYFPDNFGILVEKRNEEQLLEAIIRMYKGFEKATPSAMHAYVEKHFSPMSIAKHFSFLHHKMIEKE